MLAKREVTTFAPAPAAGGLLAWPLQQEGPAGASPAPVGTGRILVGGVGYTNLRGRSLGPVLIERLQAHSWPADVVVEDVSYGPIDVLFKLQAEPRGFRVGIFVGAVARGRSEGAIERSVWRSTDPSVDELQERISEAVTGVVSMENLLYILDHFGALPPQTVVIEVEPEAEESWGPELSTSMLAALEQVEVLVLDEVASVTQSGA